MLKALNMAVSLKQPEYAYPVRNLNTLMSSKGGRKGQNEGVLRHCLSLRPGASVKTL